MEANECAEDAEKQSLESLGILHVSEDRLEIIDRTIFLRPADFVRLLPPDLPDEFTKPGTRLTIECFGVEIDAVVEKEPLYDPRGEKIKV